MRSSFLAQHGRVSLLGQSTLGTQSSCFHSKKRNDGRPERGNGLEVRREKYIFPRLTRRGEQENLNLIQFSSHLC